MLKAIWYRPAQACVIALLSGLVTACAVMTPLYQRALDQASTRVELDHASQGATQLQLTSTGILPSYYTGPGNAIPALTAGQLAALVPPSVRRSFEAPIDSLSVDLTMPAGASQPSNGPLAWREGSCPHLDLASGRCPAAADEITVSTADARNFGLSVGTRVSVVGSLPRDVLDRRSPVVTLTVAGVYRAPSSGGAAARYWAGWNLAGYSGTNPDRSVVLHDTWLTSHATFEPSTRWRNSTTRIDLPVDRAHTHVDDLLRLGPALSAFLKEQQRRPVTSAIVLGRSGLPDIADTVRASRHQSRVTIPALMVPLGLLGLVVLWMALGAAVEQRRPEVALARLRGQGVRGARAHLLRELVPIVLAGVPVGVAAAYALAWSARRALLPDGVPIELRPPVWIAVALAILAVVSAAVLVSAGISREPIAALLRRVPVRRTGWGLGTLDAVVVTVAASILGAFVTGRLTGPVALSAPAVLALAVGLVLARLLVPVATRLGRRLLGRGRAVPGVALLQLARRPGSRATVALLTVSAAILVFTADVVAVGDRNRGLAAAQEVGAPMVATVAGGTVRAARAAVASAHRPGTDATVVVLQHPLSDQDQSSLYVDRKAFLRVATFPDRGAARRALGRLDGTTIAPIRVVGTRLSVDVATDGFYEGSRREVRLAAQLLGHDGTPVSVPLGALASGTSAATTREASVDCADGCVLTGWQLLTDPGNSGSGRVTLGSARTDAGPIDLGARGDWTPSRTEGARIDALDAGPGSLTLFVTNAGSSTLVLAHRWLPARLPTVVSGTLPPGSDGSRFDGVGLDGVERPMAAVTRLPWLPAATANATLADLDLTLRSGMALGDEAELQVWFDDEDSKALSAVRTALEGAGMRVTKVSRLSAARERLDDSAATWSMQLGVLVAIACVLVAALGLAIAGAASWRSRARDLAILRLNGLTDRALRGISLGEQIPVVLVSVLTGTAAGLVAAQYALPTLPILPTKPVVDLVDLAPSWAALVLVAVVTALALGTVGVVVAGLIARRATLEHVGGAA
ncbi:ABC transporter permease [Nocardioides pocheonensis]|uniref:ABC transporter permease n=1 Tax=Nocardioides pocheonensis TaxID=661485 RepID=A0A3N0GNT9_9ACTN|nr:ABC transporter permease [Nocardioides pocheonensis]RNM13886.1 ABC transporter permease [Nocardioides pocheonensis]